MTDTDQSPPLLKAANLMLKEQQISEQVISVNIMTGGITYTLDSKPTLRAIYALKGHQIGDSDEVVHSFSKPKITWRHFFTFGMAFSNLVWFFIILLHLIGINLNPFA